MAVFEIQGPDGKTYEVDAPDMQSAVAAIQSVVPATAGGSTTDSQAVDEFGGKLGATIAGGVNGATFGLADEATGVVEGLMTAPGEGTFVEGYRSGRDKVRAEHDRRREADPVAYGGGQIAGAMLPAALSAPLATGKTLLGTMGRGAALGMGEGAAWGFGRGEGAADSGKKAVQDAILGALIGGTIPAAISGTKALYRGIADPIGGALNVGNSGRARRAVAATVNKSGQSVDDLSRTVARAAQEGQPEFRTMDALGIAGQRRASGITRAGGEPGDELAEYLMQRQLDQGDRVAGFVDDAFDLNGRSANQVKETLTSGRNATANTAYAAARGNAAPVDVRGAVSIIDDRIGGMQGVDIAGDSIDAKLARFRNRLTANKTPEGVDSIELSDFDRVLGVKQDVQDAIGAAVRAGRNNEARELGKLASSLDEALEASSDMYRAANDGYREASRVIESIDRGADMTKPGRRAIDTVPEFSGMTPDQQAAARVGYGDRALAKIEANPAPTANKAKPFQSTKVSTEADAMTVDPRLFRDRMARETQMWETQNRALGGSRTADNLADIEGASNLASDVGGVARSAANFQLGDAAANAWRMASTNMTGQNEATRRLIAQALMSQDPRAALGPAVQSQASEILRQRMLEALIRNAARQNVSLN